MDLLTELLNKLHKNEYTQDSDVIQLIEKVSDWKVEFDSRRQVIFVGGVTRETLRVYTPRILLESRSGSWTLPSLIY